jgi:hypothetical protein
MKLEQPDQAAAPGYCFGWVILYGILYCGGQALANK